MRHAPHVVRDEGERRVGVAHVNAVATAVPDEEVNALHREMAAGFLDAPRERLFRRMVARSGIARRYGVGSHRGDDRRQAFYRPGAFPTTAARMARYEAEAPALAVKAIARLDVDPAEVTHLVVASCTGFMAPGLDQRIVALAGLDPGVERTVVGFMGCYAAVTALRVAHHVVRSAPAARVLVVNLELCSLHLQESGDLERSLAAMLFGDGCSAALVSARPAGAALHDFRAVAIEGSADLIVWRIGDQGLDMHLSGQVPRRIFAAMRAETARNDGDGLLRGERPDFYDLWAVHAGGRTILDAVETGLGLDPDALALSRAVLNDFGNMSSATLMFVLARMLAGEGRGSRGLALAFGPGLAAESFRFSRL
jgi:predicted naringenin-chalcone synthase